MHLELRPKGRITWNSRKYTSRIHCQFVNNPIVEDEDQMPFMKGYLYEDSDSDSESDHSHPLSCSCRAENTLYLDTKDSSIVQEYEILGNIDKKLHILLGRHYFKKDSDLENSVNILLKLVPNKKVYTNKLNMRILYKIISHFRSRFENAFSILETEFNEGKFFSDETYKKIKLKKFIKDKEQKCRSSLGFENDSPRSKAFFLLMRHNRKIK